MNLRLAAANLHEFFQRKGRFPGEAAWGEGAYRFCYAIAHFVVFGLLYALQTCAQAESSRADQTTPRDTIVDHSR
jgi:hypothetical protein